MGSFFLFAPSSYSSGGKKRSENPPSTTNNSPQEQIGHPGSDPLEHVEGELIIGFKSKAEAAKRTTLFKKYDAEEVLQLGQGGQVFLVKFPPGKKLKELQKFLQSEEGVKYAEPNIKMRVFPGKIPSQGSDKDSPK